MVNVYIRLPAYSEWNKIKTNMEVMHVIYMAPMRLRFSLYPDE